MKKAVKSLIVAASVAAIAGIGAVSFAAWQQGSTSDQTVEGNVGSIVTMGAITVNTDLGSKKLVPHNQIDQFDANSMAKEMNITLTYSGDEGATLTMVASGTVGGKLQYQKADETWATFTTAVEVEAGTIKVRLDSEDTADMGDDYTITFSAAAPTVA